jgi:hypothetical protein
MAQGKALLAEFSSGCGVRQHKAIAAPLVSRL